MGDASRARNVSDAITREPPRFPGSGSPLIAANAERAAKKKKHHLRSQCRQHVECSNDVVTADGVQQIKGSLVLWRDKDFRISVPTAGAGVARLLSICRLPRLTVLSSTGLRLSVYVRRLSW